MKKYIYSKDGSPNEALWNAGWRVGYGFKLLGRHYLSYTAPTVHSEIDVHTLDTCEICPRYSGAIVYYHPCPKHHLVDTCEICQSYLDTKMQRVMSSWVWYAPIALFPACLIIRALM